MDGEHFVDHSMRLGVAMAPVIMGWAFKDMVRTFYIRYLLDATGKGKFLDGTNWLVQLGVAAAWCLFVSLFTFLKCVRKEVHPCCLLYTSDAADEEDSVDLGGRRIIKKKKQETI
eukprot:TRINITY_DN8107_c0_g1_i2.p2 TRINITY_DN8107_c0_g1~~TRINITY_DN8107_c0_g1_i2.p2  ORF type:complete len:115 (+),score=19.29 TRINITY_DN8107_c0_g1_i2:583-927(+)